MFLTEIGKTVIICSLRKEKSKEEVTPRKYNIIYKKKKKIAKPVLEKLKPIMEHTILRCLCQLEQEQL